MDGRESWAGLGVYELADAARLLGLPAQSVRRWLTGYSYRGADGSQHEAEPLWQTGLPKLENRIGLSFHDLIQLRTVAHLRHELKISLQQLRKAIRHAQEVMATDYPLARSNFQTDGRQLFLDILDERHPEDRRLYDLLKRQYAIRPVVAPLFKQLDFGDDDHAKRWWPFGRKRHIVVDPQRAFGRPIVSTAGVPTETIQDVLANLESVSAVAFWFEISRADVEDAIRFENQQNRSLLSEAA